MSDLWQGEYNNGDVEENSGLTIGDPCPFCEARSATSDLGELESVIGIVDRETGEEVEGLIGCSQCGYLAEE